ncbi:hypothetical protein [Alteribacter natronophilus]|uniref:hypothetical protein n=1 Tax=Alteribacter natronophilus TaxID=2583810 RepID=UPI00148662F8|nr:hypothetical protein [Alteribacter natronophilus]
MTRHTPLCLACEGSGLLMDDEEWHYTCTICGGSGEYTSSVASEVQDTDPNHRTLE